MNEKNKKYFQKNKSIVFGIEILRMILCFWVITFHYSGNIIKFKYKIINHFYHVPTFFFLSFYLTYKIFILKNIVKIKQRFERLIISYIIIPIIFIIIKFFSSDIKRNIKQILIDLYLQYITGHYFYIHLWFIQNLIIYTIIFGIIFLLFKKNNLFILQIQVAILYWLKCNGIINKIFDKKNKKLIPFRYIATMMPIAISGIILGYKEILKKLMIFKIKSIIFCIIIFYFIYSFNFFGEISLILVSISLFIFFSLIPLEKIKNKTLINFIQIISKHTGGIYYFQRNIQYLIFKFSFFRIRPFLSCCIIYIFGYIICMLGTKIFKRNKLKYLFN